MNSKKMIACLTLVLGLFAVNSTYAQRGGNMDTAAMRQRMEARIQKMHDDLKLTSVQTDSMRAIQMDRGTQMRNMMMDPSNQGLSREDRMAKMQPLNDAINARIQKVLGDDLYKKYQDWEAANRPQRGGGGGN